MKSKITLKSFILFISLYAAGISSGIGKNPLPKPTENVIVNWQLIQENNAKLVDVFYRIVQCDTNTVIELKVFNENSITQDINFDLKVSSPMNNKSFSNSVKLADVPAGNIFSPQCGSKTHSNLTINLPSDFDASKPLTLSITFK